MGFVLGQPSTVNKTSPNRKFVLGSQPVQPNQTPQIVKQRSLTPDEVKKPVAKASAKSKLDIMEKRLSSDIPKPKTPLDPSRFNIVGQNLIPTYEEDKGLAKFGKEAVNYGAGTALRTLEAVPQAIMKTVSNIGNAVKGKPQDWSDKTLRKDILPPEYDKALRKLASTGKGGEIASVGIDMLINMGLDPTTYVMGGVVDDLAKAGVVGKASKPSTEFVQVVGERQAAVLAKQAAKNAKNATKTASKTVQKAAGITDEVQDAITTPRPQVEVQKNADELRAIAGDNNKIQPVSTAKPIDTPLTDDVAQKGVQDVKPVSTIKMDNRTAINVGTPKVKAYMFENPEVKDLYQGAARYILDNEYVPNEQFSPTTAIMKQLKADTGLQPAEIKDALERLVKNHGQENQAAAKRVELVIDDMLTNGFDMSDGIHIDANEDYLKLKSAIEGRDVKPIEKVDGGEFEDAFIKQTEDKGIAKPYEPNVPKSNVIEFKPKTPNQKKYVEQVTAKLPNSADELGKKIADLELKAVNEKDKSKLLKINLQLFAAKEKLKTFTDIPRGNLPDGEVERGFSKNVRTDKSMPDEIRESFDEKPLGYKQKTNEETLAKAETIMAKGQAEALSEYYTLINGKKYSAEAVPLAKLIAKKAQETGDIATARQVLSDAAVKLTEAGQFSQAAKILRESDPETFLITVQKQLNKLNKEGSKFYKKKWNKLDLTDDEIARIGKTKKGDNAAYESMMEEIHNRIALDVPSNAWEKFDSWRRMAMLMNPTTHIRNVVGNTIMGGMQKTSDSVAAILERAFVPQAERTKSILWRTDKTRIATVSKAWEANKKQLMKGGRWDLESGVGTLKELNSIKPVFKTKLEVANKLSKDLLNAEDNIFVKAVWENSLGSYMKARNITEVTDEAVEYATRRAYEATFKQANLLSTTINKIKNVPVVGRLAEGAIPFSKTPSNIAMRAVEYSPIGIMKALYSATAKKGAAAVIEDFSKAATGTGIAAIGYTLAAAGWARGKTSTSAKVEALRSKQGKQANSITTQLGSYTVDWAQPFAIPFFMGVAMYEELQNPKYDGKLSEAILNSIYKGGDTLFEMTMLRNIKQILGYGSTTEKIGATMLSYIEQAIPSVLGKMARSIDPNSRETYDPNPAKEEWNKVVAKVPWLSAVLPEKIDNFGEVIKNSSALEQFLSPGYTKGKDTRTFMKELERLYEVEKDTDIIPSVTTGKISDNSIDYVMTADEYTRFKKTYGNNIMNGYTGGDGIKRLGLNALIESPEYKKIKSDKDKFKRITKLYSKAYELAKSEFLKGRGMK
jgi:hypothetical protein